MSRTAFGAGWVLPRLDTPGWQRCWRPTSRCLPTLETNLNPRLEEPVEMNRRTANPVACFDNLGINVHLPAKISIC